MVCVYKYSGDTYDNFNCVIFRGSRKKGREGGGWSYQVGIQTFTISLMSL